MQRTALRAPLSTSVEPCGIEAMARYRIPKNAGRVRVQVAMAGNYIVLNDKTGGGKIIIRCRDREQAERLCEKLNAGEHDGEVWTRAAGGPTVTAG